MEIVVVIVVLALVCFGGTVFFGAPYVPTLRPQIQTALDLLALTPGQTFIEVGSGDGRVLIAAAERGLIAYGYEINPLLVAVSLWRTRAYRGRVHVVWADAWRVSWPTPDGVFIFGLHRLVEKLHTKIVQEYAGPVRIASIGFELDGVQPLKAENGVFLYEHRARGKLAKQGKVNYHKHDATR